MSALAPKNPLFIGLLGLGALYLVARRSATAAAVPAASTVQRYSTPTSVAAQLAGLVVAITKNVNAQAPSNTQVTIDTPTGTGRDGSQGVFGWSFDKGFNFGGVLDSWSTPAASFVNTGAQSGGLTDSFLSAPVYDLSTGFANNPFALQS